MGAAAVDIAALGVAAFVAVVGIFGFSNEIQLGVSFQDNGPVGGVFAKRIGQIFRATDR